MVMELKARYQNDPISWKKVYLSQVRCCLLACEIRILKMPFFLKDHLVQAFHNAMIRFSYGPSFNQEDKFYLFQRFLKPGRCPSWMSPSRATWCLGLATTISPSSEALGAGIKRLKNIPHKTWVLTVKLHQESSPKKLSQ